MSSLNRKRSTIWNHFTIKSSTIAKCSYCRQELTYSGGSTSNLLRHLKTKHVIVPLTRPLRNENSPFENKVDVDDLSNVQGSSNALVSTFSLVILPEPIEPSNPSRQSTITQFISSPISISKSKAIDLQITKFIVKHFHPFSSVEETEFCDLIKMLSPNYTIPSRKTISNSLLLKIYENVLEKVKTDLHNVTALSLTTDG